MLVSQHFINFDVSRLSVNLHNIGRCFLGKFYEFYLTVINYSINESRTLCLKTKMTTKPQ